MRHAGLSPHTTAVRRRRGWRIRWRRVVAVGLGILLVGGIAALVTSASQAASPTGPAVAVVQPGDTLWSVVARHVPSRDPYGMIEEIRRLNGLTDHTVHPGQELMLP